MLQLFRKRLRSVRRLSCKRACNGFLPLPCFCGLRLRRRGIFFCNASPFRAQHELCPDFFEGNASPHFCKHTVRFRFYNLYAKNRKGKMDMLKK